MERVIKYCRLQDGTYPGLRKYNGGRSANTAGRRMDEIKLPTDCTYQGAHQSAMRKNGCILSICEEASCYTADAEATTQQAFADLHRGAISPYQFL